jgi:hypothetical protein
MLGASFGEELDFTSVISERRRNLLDEIELSESELNEIRKLQEEYQALSCGERTLTYDPELAKALKSLESESDPLNLRGQVRFSDEESELGWEGRE